jgi:zona occludens toxin
MIELNTGIPGSGKSLSNVKRLSELLDRWAAHPEEARPVFVYNIPDLILPHSEVPLCQYHVNSKVPVQWVVDWEAMPDNSLVLIDECAKLFPPRSSASAMPPYIEFLTVHRKRGFDIWFTTQNPKFVDHGLRALVGKHLHFRRVFGMQRSIVYEWDSCSDSCASLKTAVKSYFPFPKKIFKYYKSAEIHTKQSFRLPLWLLLPFISLALGLYFVPRAYAVLAHGTSGKGISVDDKPAIEKGLALQPQSGSAAPLGAAVTAAAVVPLVVPDSRLISACMATLKHCQCYNHDGIHIAMDDFDCRIAADHPTKDFRLNVSDRSVPVIRSESVGGF